MRVLDLSVDVAGGFCSKLLAMNGVRVLRPLPPAEGWLDRYLHAGKERPAAPTEVELAELARSSDVVVTSYEAGRLLGRAAELVASDRPALSGQCVHLVTSTFGSDGPYAEFRSSPLVEWAAGGYLFITGDPERPPLAGPSLLCGYVAGYTAAVAVEAALARRRATGGPCRIDVSTMESMLSMHQSTFSRLGAGILRTRTGRYTEVFPLVVLPCSDGYVSIGVVTDAEFDRLAVAMGRPDLPLDPRFSSSPRRTSHAAELEPILRRWLASRTCTDVVGLLHDHGLASAKVASPEELLDSEQLGARRFWETSSVGGRPLPMPGNPFGHLSLLDGPEPARSKERPDRTDGNPVGLPLAGPPPVRVLDLTAFWAGPSATRNLADLGAEVIRIERPGSRLDFAAAADGDPVQALFDHKTNRKKRSVVMDLRQPQGRELFLRLVEQSDVVVENYRAGVMDALGLSAATMAERNGRLVHVALSGFGGTGPWSKDKSYGPTIEAASSIEHRTRYPEAEEPFRLGHTLPDGVGGLAGTYAVLLGLRRRAETGRGVSLDVSQLEAYVTLSGEELLGVAARRLGLDAPADVPFDEGLHPCRGDDDWIVVAPRTGTARAALDRVVGGDPAQDLSARTRRHDKSELAARLQAAGVAAFPVLRPDELVRDPHLSHRGYFVPVEFAGRHVPLPGSPLRAEAPLVDPLGAPPDFGAHTAEVLMSLLGLSEAEVEQLIDAQVVVDPGVLTR